MTMPEIVSPGTAAALPPALPAVSIPS